MAALRWAGDFGQAVEKAARIRGDSDLVADLTGALVGAALGPGAIPAPWRETLPRREAPHRPRPAVRGTGWGEKSGWLGLELESPWVRGLAQEFVNTANAGPRQTPVKAKSWLHLTLANDFPWRQQAPLAALARQMVDPEAAVSWELRYYQRDPGGCWRCHRAWGLPTMLPGVELTPPPGH